MSSTLYPSSGRDPSPAEGVGAVENCRRRTQFLCKPRAPTHADILSARFMSSSLGGVQLMRYSLHPSDGDEEQTECQRRIDGGELPGRAGLGFRLVLAAAIPRSPWNKPIHELSVV